MRETRLYGSEGGEAKAFPTPIINKATENLIYVSFVSDPVPKLKPALKN